MMTNEWADKGGLRGGRAEGRLWERIGDGKCHVGRDMQLGAMLESGEVASSKWSAHPILWWYQM